MPRQGSQRRRARTIAAARTGPRYRREVEPAQFVATMRTGVDPNGHRLGEQMPWRPIGRMDNDELAAIYQYLLALPGS